MDNDGLAHGRKVRLRSFQQWTCRVGDGIQQASIVHTSFAANEPNSLFKLFHADASTPSRTHLGEDQIRISCAEPSIQQSTILAELRERFAIHATAGTTKA